VKAEEVRVLFRQLEYFIAVAQERHFARAAEKCYVSQPALSAAIAKLERELNVTLINRGHSFAGLTPEGERLVMWAKRILAEHDAFKAEVHAVRSGITGTLRLGKVPTASTTASLVLSAFCSAHPLAKVQISSRLAATELYRRLREFELDAAIVHSASEGAPRRGPGAALRRALRAAVVGGHVALRRIDTGVAGRRTVAAGVAHGRYAGPPDD
jgi:DNA-binding transcriptional LysR family regulator